MDKKPDQPAAESAPAQTAQPTTTPAKKTKKGLIIGSIVAGTLVVLGGGAALAYNYWYQNPEKVVLDAFSNTIRAKTITGTGKFTLKSNDIAIDIKFDGESNAADGRLNMTIRVEGETLGQTLTVKTKSSMVVKGDTVYIKAEDVRSAINDIADATGGEQFVQALEPIIKKIDGQWISIKPSDFKEIDTQTEARQRCFADLSKKWAKDKAMQNEMVDIYKKNRFVVIDEKLPAKNVNNIGSLGYKISINKETTQTFLKALADTEVGKEMNKCDDAIDFAEMADSISRRNSSGSGEVRAELWASWFGHDLTELRIEANEKGNSALVLLNPVYNKAISVEAPADAISFKQLQADIEEFMAEYQMPTEDDDYYDNADDAVYNLN